MDVLFRAKGQYSTVILGISDKGIAWIKENMSANEHEYVTIQAEHEAELRSLIEKDGLTVQER